MCSHPKCVQSGSRIFFAELAKYMRAATQLATVPYREGTVLVNLVHQNTGKLVPNQLDSPDHLHI